MRVFVTGIAGFIGSHVARELLAQGDEVLGIDDLSGGRHENVPQGADFVQRDCGELIDDLLEQFRPQCVMHLAAYAAEGLSHHIPSFNYQSNLTATANVLAAAQRQQVERFVFTSSIAAYGHAASDSRPITEETPCRPCDPYGIAKFACEQHIASVAEYFGGPSYTIFRPHNVFGPYQNISDPYRNVVGIFLRCIRSGAPLPVFGDGQQTRCFSYVDVVAKCMARSLRLPEAVNQVFNVGGDETWSVLKLAETLIAMTDSKCSVKYLPARQEVKHARADHAKAKRVFPDVFRNAMSVLLGLEQTWKHVANAAIPPTTPCPAEVEIWERLPPSWKDSLK